MWVRKSQFELKQERDNRRRRFETSVVAMLLTASIFVLWYVGSVERLIQLLRTNPESAFSLIFLPVLIYFGYRNYVLHGGLRERTGKMCLACEQGMGYGDDGWRFKVYGMKKRRWYQIKACRTPEKCDIVCMFEVKWVPDRNDAEKNA